MIDFLTTCRQACPGDWARALEHPFVAGLAAGTLQPAQIRTYLIQDRLYLHSYVRVCRTLAGRAHTQEERHLFEESARLSEDAEAGMQSELFQALGLTPGTAPAGPATRAYMEHETTCSENDSDLVALAAATPCTVLYADLGRMLNARPETRTPTHPFRAWLDLYADPSVQDMAQAWTRTLNQWARMAPSGQHAPALAAFAQSTRCEIAFWQQAWQNSGPEGA